MIFWKVTALFTTVSSTSLIGYTQQITSYSPQRGPVLGNSEQTQQKLWLNSQTERGLLCFHSTLKLFYPLLFKCRSHMSGVWIRLDGAAHFLLWMSTHFINAPLLFNWQIMRTKLKHQDNRFMLLLCAPFFPFLVLWKPRRWGSICLQCVWGLLAMWHCHWPCGC